MSELVLLNVAEATTAPQTQLLTLDEGLTAWAQGLGLSPSERPEDDYLIKLASQYHAEQYEDSYRQMSKCVLTIIYVCCVYDILLQCLRCSCTPITYTESDLTL